MSNMSYCRFRNTEADLEECLDALIKRDISSDSEKGAARRILTSVLDFCNAEGIIEDYDKKRIDELLSACSSEDEEED